MSELALKIIYENIAKHERGEDARVLDLGNCGLETLPEEALECVWVEELVLGEVMPYKYLPIDLIFFYKTNVEDSVNRISALPPGLAKMQQLKKLVIIQLKVPNHQKLSDLSPLVALTNLQVLDITGTRVNDLSPLAALVNLQTIKTSYTKVNDLSPLSRLINLHTLECNHTEISNLTPLSSLDMLEVLEFSNTNVDDLTPLAGLTNISYLNFSYTSISTLLPLEDLVKLRSIFCTSTLIEDLSPLSSLIALNFLDFSETQVSDLRPLYDLYNLQLIDCSSTQVNDLSPLLYLINRGMLVKWDYDDYGIIIVDCPLIYPPAEIAKQGNEAILRYFEERDKQGQEVLLEAKIVVVGAGESGKTTLIRKLYNPYHPVPNSDDKRTKGVVVSEFQLRGQWQGRPVSAYLWDLGGQELYHTTHQFFLTPDTFYILLNDNRKNDTDFYYWLNVLALRAGDNCPILCIFNQKENSTRKIALDDRLLEAFPGLLRRPEDIDFADSDMSLFEKLRDTIEGHFLQMPVLGKPFPSYWVAVRDALAELTEPHITWRRFREICIAQHIPEEDEQQMRIIAQTLHNLGNMLWFPQVFGVQDLVVLDSQWCLDAMYKVLDAEPVKKAGGRFDREMMRELWSAPIYEDQHLRLEALMRYFDLCYETEPNSGRYIAPQLLPPEEKPRPDFPKRDSIVFRHKYEFMPAGLMTRFIARTAAYIDGGYVWRKGVSLRWGQDTRGEAVEDPISREIVLRAAGPERKRRMDEMRKTLEIVESLFRGLKVQHLVSCNCPDCLSTTDPTTFDLGLVEKEAYYDDEMTCYKGGRKKVPARQILEGLAYHDTPRIFISYSHRSENYKDEFRTMIAPLERSGQWRVWDDRYLLPGDQWNEAIMRQLADANVIVLLLTPAFFDSDYIWNIELTRAVERHTDGTALMLGVIVEDCLWEETPLRTVQLVPRDGKPVVRHEHRSEVWKEVAELIKKAVAARERGGTRMKWERG